MPTRLITAVTESDLNPAYISAFSALAGALIGGLTSFGTSWFTQQAQLRHAHREAERAKLEALYNDFIVEAARLFGESLTHQTEDITSMVRLYALVGRMRLVSARAVIDAVCGSRTTLSKPTWGQTALFMNCETLPAKAG